MTPDIRYGYYEKKNDALSGGDLPTLTDALGWDTPNEHELGLAVINLCGIIAQLEKRIARMEQRGIEFGWLNEED